MTQQKGLTDTMHSVHNASVTGEDDRIAQIAIENKARMLNDLAASEMFDPFVCPMRFIKLVNN